MNKLFHYVTYALFLWVMLGSGVILYMQNLDGSVFNKPVTYSMDTEHVKTDKTVYHRGDTVYLQFSLCRTRTVTAKTQWRLINETIIFFPEQDYILKPTCIKDKWISVGEIPPYSILGTHHFEGTTQMQVNPLHDLYFNYRSNDFEVI